MPEKPELILLDDAFQHRKVKAGLNILLTTYDNLYTHDFMLPSGNLREPKTGANRADIIVVTKCPMQLSNLEKKTVLRQINPKGNQQVFFSYIQYADEAKSLEKTIKIDALQHFTLVTGIANPTPLVEFLKNKGLRFEHLSFKDHHNFSVQDIEKLKVETIILATEKDFVRLKKYNVLRGKLYYLPIEIKIENAKVFDNLLRSFVKSY